VGEYLTFVYASRDEGIDNSPRNMKTPIQAEDLGKGERERRVSDVGGVKQKKKEAYHLEEYLDSGEGTP